MNAETIAGNAPLRLDDGHSVWRLLAGTVHVFSVPTESGESIGARHFLFELTAPAVIFAARGAPAGMTLLAVAAGSARVVRADRDDLAPLQPAAGEIASALDRWVLALAVLRAQALPRPRRWLELGPGRGWLAADGQGLTSSAGILWVGSTEDRVRYLGSTALPMVQGEDLAPVGPGLWVTAVGDASVDARTTADLLATPDGWRHVDAFHERMMGLAVLRLSAARQQEHRRLIARGEREEAARATSYARLLAAFVPPEEAPLPAGADPLWAAARLVWRAAGVTPSTFEDIPLEDSGPDGVLRLTELAGVRYRAVTLTRGWWNLDAGPLLGALAAEAQPVALLPAGAGRYEMVDPRDGLRRTVTEAEAQRISPRAFMFYRALPARPLGFLDLARHAVPAGDADLRRILGYTAFAALVGLLPPVLTSTLVDQVIPGADLPQLAQVSIALLVGALGIAGLELVRGAATVRLEGRATAALQEGLWERLLGLPVMFFRDFTAGELAERANAVNRVRELLGIAAVNAALSGAFACASAGLLLYYAPKLGATALAALALLVVATAWLTRERMHALREVTRRTGELAGMVLQMVSGVAKIKVAGAEDRAFLRWAGPFADLMAEQLRADRLSAGATTLVALFPVATSAGLFALVSYQMQQGESVSPGAFVAFFAAFAGLSAATGAVVNAGLSSLQAIPLMERAKPILGAVPEVDVSRADPGNLVGGVRVDRVSFRYRPDGPLILDDVSFDVQPGEFVALVGPSGSGKSTLIRLLLGFETPEGGTIAYDGHDLAWLDVRAVRRQVGTVLQTGKLMAGSVLSNIVGSSRRTADEAWEAARMCGLAEDIEHMPMGMHTVLPQGATTLSGGQRQRLLIARALVRQPRVLLFDEATSALDNRTQAVVGESLSRLRVTRIVIAHRLSTIKGADRIVVIDRGRVAEQGTYASLMERNGIFADLARRQIVQEASK